MRALLQQCRQQAGGDLGGSAASAPPQGRRAADAPRRAAGAPRPLEAAPPDASRTADSSPRCPEGSPSSQLCAALLMEQWAPASQQPAPLPARGEQPADGNVFARWLSLWGHEAELDRLFFPLAVGMWLPYIWHLWPVTTAAEQRQHVALLFILLLNAASAWGASPAAYRRWSPLLRLAFLCYALCLPFVTSLNIFHHTAPGPSQVPGLRLLLDAYQLWMATRCALVVFVIVGAHPPLHVAVPFQLLALWRINGAGFCDAAILRHPAMRRRTDITHSALSMVSQTLGFPAGTTLFSQDPDQQCHSLLLFLSILLSGLLPALLLVPLGRCSNGRTDSACAPPRARPLRSLQALDRQLERGLDWLTCSATQRQQGEEPLAGVLCVLRRLILVSTLWLLCCVAKV